MTLNPATPFLSGRFAIEQAEALGREFGADAALAAAARAHHYRSLDNAILYARWREVERLVQLPVAMSGACRH